MEARSQLRHRPTKAGNVVLLIVSEGTRGVKRGTTAPARGREKNGAPASRAGRAYGFCVKSNMSLMSPAWPSSPPSDETPQFQWTHFSTEVLSSVTWDT